MRVGGAVHHQHGVTHRNGQVIEDGLIGVDGISHALGQIGQLVIAAHQQADLRTADEEVPVVSCDHGAGQQHGCTGTLHLGHGCTRCPGLGDDFETHLEAQARAIGNRQHVAVRASAKAVGTVDQQGQCRCHIGQTDRTLRGVHRGGVAILTRDHDRPTVAIDRCSAQGQHGAGGLGGIDAFVGNAQGVNAGRSLHPDGLHFRHGRHVQTGQCRAGQRGVAVAALGLVVHIERVIAQTTHHRQQGTHGRGQRVGGLDQIRRGQAGDPDLVVAVAGVNRRVAVNRLDINQVVALAGADVRGTRVGGQQMHRIGTGTQFQGQHLDAGVDNAAGQRASGNDGVTSHAQTGDVVGRDEDFIVGRAVAVGDD